MARTFSSELDAVLATNQAASALLLEATIEGTDFFWADRTLEWGGETYAPLLAADGEITFRRGLSLDTAGVRLCNVTLAVSDLLKTQYLQGSAAAIKRLYLQAEETVTLFDGVLVSAEINETEASLRLASKLDPSQRKVPPRLYGALCPWRFKSPECGYSGGESVCNHTIPDCTTRAQLHRFGGFVHIDRELQETSQPLPDPDPRPEADFGAGWYGDES